MPPTREQLTAEQFDALLAMLTDDGGGGPGSVDPEHVAALRRVRGFDASKKIAQAHREGRGPPEDLGGRGPPENGGGGGGGSA